MSFYRQYRPQTIDEIDNVHVRDQITSLLKKDRRELPHAYLLTGPKGAGKTTAARILAKLYLCTKEKKKTGPCGECEQCTSIASGTNMDVLEIDAASNRGIDEIRELRDRIALAPSGGAFKIYIIDEVHMLTTEAFNALLKTLEEPPKHAVFVLATTDPQKIPSTILSRCITIPFRRATQEELESALKKIVVKEEMSIDDDALSFIATESDGAFRDAVKLLEQMSFAKKKITIDAITDLLSSSDDGQRNAFLEALAKKDEQAALKILDALSRETKDLKSFCAAILKSFQTMLVALGKGETVYSWDASALARATKLFIDAYGLMKISPIAELPLELAVLEWCGGGDKQSVSPPPVSAGKLPDTKPVLPTKLTEETVKGRGEEKEERENETDDSFTIEKLEECWKEVIEALKPFNHSVAGVMRSAHPKHIAGGVVTIATKYKFHQERLSEPNVRDMVATVFKKLFGVRVHIDVVLEEQ